MERYVAVTPQRIAAYLIGILLGAALSCGPRNGTLVPTFAATAVSSAPRG